MEKSDLSHWDLIDHFLPEEVSALIFGNDPSWVKNPSDKRFTVVVDRMASDFDLSISSFLRLIKCKSFDQERFPPEGGLMSLELKRKYQLAKMMSMNKEEFANEEDILNSMKNWAQIAEEQFHQVYFQEWKYANGLMKIKSAQNITFH
jgi:hypothetical protein